MIQLTAYYERWQGRTTIIPPESMVSGIADFLSKAKESLDDGTFQKFARDHKRDFEGMALFIFDHQGFYDRQRCYNWQTLQPVVRAIFEYGLQLPHKDRFLALSGNYMLAIYALDNDDVAGFVLSHFKVYAELPDKVCDSHGRAQNILEAMFAKLQSLKGGKDFTSGSPQWALELLIKRYVYNL